MDEETEIGKIIRMVVGTMQKAFLGDSFSATAQFSFRAREHIQDGDSAWAIIYFIFPSVVLP